MGHSQASLLYHAVEGGMGVHTTGVAQLRHLELVKKFLYALRLNLTEIGLVDVEDRERLDKGDDIEVPSVPPLS